MKAMENLERFRYCKYHALGNDYIILKRSEVGTLTQREIQVICHRNFGLGSDGILVYEDDKKTFVLTILNPDGSEAEKSGNGLRIFSKYLWDNSLVKEEPFCITTKGGDVASRITQNGNNITIEMGKVYFSHLYSPTEEGVLGHILKIEDTLYNCNIANVGNPHCVIIQENISARETKKIGSQIEIHPFFPNKTNVQFVKILDRSNIQIEIWERGAGYTLASGSSSCAAASVAYKLGLCDNAITVSMPGGQLFIDISQDFSICMTGGATKVSDGYMYKDIFEYNISLSSNLKA